MSRIIIFGCGGVGSKAMNKLLKDGNEIICFTDNSRKKWGTSYEGKRVICPQNIKKEKFDYVAIGVYKAVDSIRQQLTIMGINDEKIIVPIKPKRIFYNDDMLSDDELILLEQTEYTSRNTREYMRLGIKITDREFLNRIELLKKVLLKYNVPRRNVCIVSGAVLEVLGLRKSKEFDDIDIIMTEDLRRKYGEGLVIISEKAEMHAKDLYDISDDEIVKNEKYHFVVDGMKYVHPQLLYQYLQKHNLDEYKLLQNINLWTIEY